jgi:hypothetical protein
MNGMNTEPKFQFRGLTHVVPHHANFATMNFSRAQQIGAFVLLTLLLAVALWRGLHLPQ